MSDPLVRLFTQDEWDSYREVRLLALHSDPGVFASTHTREVERPDEAWRERLLDPMVGVFGVFDGDAVIGMTGIYRPAERPGSAALWGSWLRPEWRGQGLSVLMYEARLAWAGAQPEIERILVSHRASNSASAAANGKHGFVRVGEVERDWPDGAREPEVQYELLLDRAAPDGS